MNANFTPKFKTLSFVLIERPGYAPQFRRGYACNVTAEKLANPVLDDLIDYRAIAQPSFPIANGWDAPRYSFQLIGEYEMLVGCKVMITIAGYTSALVPADKVEGSDMRFVINSVQSSRRTIEKTQEGYREYLNPIEDSHVYAHPEYQGGYDLDARRTKVRPVDIYQSMKLSHLASPGDTFDLRTILHTRPVSARRALMIPSFYLNDIVMNYRRASLDSSIGIQREEDILENARGYAQESLLAHNPFFRALERAADGFSANSFTWSELLMVDPEISAVTAVATTGTPRDSDYQTWEGTDATTQAAWGLAMGVPALMSMLAITQVKFFATNILAPTAELEDPTLKNSFFITEVRSSIYDNIKEDLIKAFTGHFERYLLPKLSMHGQIGYMVRVDSDMFGDTVVDIRLGKNGEAQRFLIPTFADSLMTPLVSTGKDSFLVRDLETILQETVDQDWSPAGPNVNGSK